MNIQDFSNEFSLVVFSQNIDLGTSLKLALNDKKYECQLYADADLLLNDLAHNIPHVIIVDVPSLVLPLHEYIEKCLSVSHEIKFIILAPAASLKALKNYRQYGVMQIIDSSAEVSAVENQVAYAVDNTCEVLYRTYQNEQLFENYKSEQMKSSDLLSILNSERQSTTVRPYQIRISQYKTAESKENLLDLFYSQTPSQSWIFLKYASSIKTFIAVSFSQVPESWIEGLSFKVPQRENNFIQQILLGETPDSMVNYLKNKFESHNIKFLPLVIKNELEGVLISTQDISADVAEDFSLMSLVYSLLAYESQPKHLDIEDSLTGFYNKVFYQRLLEREIERARRDYLPLSIIKIGIDKFSELEISHGRSFADEILKKVSNVIKLTSRIPDYLCRTSENEFTAVLIDCNRKGAAIRAERLRTELNKESYSKNGIAITVSQGISEYPSLSHTVEDLDESAQKSLQFIFTKGGDKICIYKPSSNHKPEFTVS